MTNQPAEQRCTCPPCTAQTTVSYHSTCGAPRSAHDNHGMIHDWQGQPNPRCPHHSKPTSAEAAARRFMSTHELTVHAETYEEEQDSLQEIEEMLAAAFRAYAEGERIRRLMLDAASQQPDAVAVLREVEWVADHEGDRRCLICREFSDRGHADDCKLAAALRGGQR